LQRFTRFPRRQTCQTISVKYAPEFKLKGVNMEEQMQAGVWHIVLEGDGENPMIRDQGNHEIASIASVSKEKMLARASMIAAAPDLYEAVDVALQVFKVMALHAKGEAALAAQDMIPALESALEAANFLGEITPEKLVGQ
jgi:hypothetical protein